MNILEVKTNFNMKEALEEEGHILTEELEEVGGDIQVEKGHTHSNILRKEGVVILIQPLLILIIYSEVPMVRKMVAGKL